MSLDIKVPAFGESITSANVARWHKASGSAVRKGETLVTFETDKVSSELESPADGTLTISQVTAEFHVGRTTAYSWMQLGLPYSTASGRRLLPRRAVVELLAAGLVGVEKPELQVA